MTSAAAPPVLDDAQFAAYQRDGFVCLGAVLGSADVEALLAVERRFRLADSYGASPGLVVMDQLAHVSSDMRRFCCDGGHLDAVVQLLGPDVVLTHNQFVAKLPGHGQRQSEIPLHQDNGYGTLDPPDDVTVWVALTDTTVDNGCLVVAPGSHRAGLLTHREADHNPAFREVGGAEVVPLELAAGEAVAFSGLLLHGSGDNHTDVERVAIFARYCRPDAVMLTEGGRPVLADGHSWMVRGEAPMSTWQSANDKFTSAVADRGQHEQSESG